MKQLTLGLLVSLCTCTGTRTGNPFEEPPSYQSGSRFVIDPVGGSSDLAGNLGGGGGRFNTIAAELWALRDGLLFGFYAGGFGVFDVSDPEAPALLGALPSSGGGHQLLLDGRPGAQAATLAIYERTMLDADEGPEGPMHQWSERLVRVDLSDPSAPRRTSEVELPGRFWHFEQRGDDVYVLHERLPEDDSLCGSTDVDLLPQAAATSLGMVVTRYRLEGEALVEAESVELPAESSYAWQAGDAYFATEDSEDPGFSGKRLWRVSFDSPLVADGPLELGGRLLDVAAGSDRLLALTVDGTATSLEVFSLASDGTATARGTLTLPRGGSRVHLAPSGLVYVDGGGCALLDLSDLDAPTIAATLPADVERLTPLGDTLLGLGPDHPFDDSGHGNLVVSLWSTGSDGAPSQLDRVVTAWPFDSGPRTAPERVAPDGKLLLYPYGLSEQPALGVLHIAGDALGSAQSVQTAALWYRPLTNSQSAFGLSRLGLEVVGLDNVMSETEPTLLDLEGTDPNRGYAHLELDGLSLQARSRERDGIFVLDALSDGAPMPQTVELTHRADDIVEIGNRVLVIGLEDSPGCDLPNPPEELFASPNPGLSPCAPHRRAGATLFTLDADGTPRRLSSIALNLPPVTDGPADVDVREHWLGFATLSDGRVALFRQRYTTCASRASCDALGVQAHESLGMGTASGCGSADPSCDDAPAPTSPAISISGSKPSLRVYVLDVLDGLDENSLSLDFHTELPGRYGWSGAWTFNRNNDLLWRDDGFGIAREEELYDAQGNSLRDENDQAISRFYLERIAIDADGKLQALESINTPGQPVAWSGDDLYAIEPEYVDGELSAVLHRARLHELGAYLEDSLDLGGRLLAVRGSGDELWGIRAPEMPCEAGAQSELLVATLMPKAMTTGQPLSLPGSQWHFPRGETTFDGDRLVLHGGPVWLTGRLWIDRQDPLAPRVERYFTVPYP
ncbi:MAG: hypothetical protein OEZ06_09030 [Myxococcales bacterium]|nr:hypothetical protein [Myxococcales bacterium]